MLCLLLNSNVRQMDGLLVQIRQVELLRRRPAVAFLCHVDLQVVIQEDPNADVELSALYQKWVLQVLLYYELWAFVREGAPFLFLTLWVFSQGVLYAFLLNILYFLFEKVKWIKKLNA